MINTPTSSFTDTTTVDNEISITEYLEHINNNTHYSDDIANIKDIGVN